MQSRFHLLVVVIASFFANAVFSQTIITGKVLANSGETIPGANIYILGSYDGTSSDANGHYLFQASSKDTAIIKASFIGFKEFSKALILDQDTLHIDIFLSEKINYLNEVVISAGTFEAGSSHKSEVLRPLDIVTTAGVTADIAGALNTLPGTQTVGEEGRLFVRGGDAYETTTFIDGLVVQESYDITAPRTPTRSRFSPFMFSGTSFSTGGYSAEYGQGLSSALILNTKDVATETRTDLSFMSVGLEAAHSQIWGDASLAAKIGYINLDPYYEIIKQEFNWIDPPTSMDSNIAFRKKVGKNGLFKTYGKFNLSEMRFNHDPFTVDNELIDMTLKNKYAYINNSYKDVLSKKWLINTGISYTYSSDDILMDQDIINERSQGIHLKSVVGHEFNERIFLRMGAELITKAHSQDFTDYETGFDNRFSFDEKIGATFVEGKIFLSRSFLARIGVRTEYNSLSRNLSIDPRISLALKSGEHGQFSFAFGIFRQSPPNQLLRIASFLNAERSSHLIINYQFMKNNRTFRIEAYNKEYNDLVTFDPDHIFIADRYSNSGDGYARGVDIFYRDGKTIENADFWISYSYLDTEREYRGFPNAAAPSYTSKHNFSVVYKHFISDIKSQLGLTYTVTSGRPYNNPNQEIFNDSRTPVFHDLSANVSYLPKPNLIIYASFTNLFGRENIFGYQFRMMPGDMNIYDSKAITLPAPRFLFLGVFVTLTESGGASQLPNL